MIDRLTEARAYKQSGLSMTAIGVGSKTSPIQWKVFQERLPKDEEIVDWVTRYPGLAIVCGAVSGNLEVLDLEANAPIKEFAKRVNERDPDLLPRLPRNETPSGGRHIPYRCKVIQGNQKLAADTNGKTLIETRGTGGYVLSPLCLPETHPSGKPYKVLAGDYKNIPTITPEQREILLSVARSFNEYIEPKKAKGIREAAQGNGTRPGEDFNNRPDALGQVQELLRENAWSKFSNTRVGESWSRPGVSDHGSATLYDNGALYVFSSNALPFSAGEAYSPFAIYAELKHSGDFSAAAKALVHQGYGKQSSGNGHHAPKITTPSTVEPDAALRFVRMAEVVAKPVEWLWKLFIAIGAVTIVEGPPGVGKSTLCCAVTAAITRGKGLPGMDSFEPGTVLLCSAEDSKAHTLRPRLDAAGADVTRVFALDEPLTLDSYGMLQLETAVIKYKPRFVYFDPFFAFTGSKKDIHRANEMREVTAWQTAIAEKYGCAILDVRHLAKSRGQGHALNAGVGSIDLVAAARSVLLVGQDPDDGRRRAMVQIKNNLGPVAPAIGFTLEDGNFYWTGESNLTADRILSLAGNQEERSAVDEAIDFLRESLAAGDRETAEVMGEARRVGITDKTLRNARERLKIRARREGLPGTKQRFYWSLPELAEQNPATEEIFIPAGANDERIDEICRAHQEART